MTMMNMGDENDEGDEDEKETTDADINEDDIYVCCSW